MSNKIACVLILFYNHLIGQDSSPRYTTPSSNTIILHFKEWKTPDKLSEPAKLILYSEPVAKAVTVPNYLSSYYKPNEWNISFYAVTRINNIWHHSKIAGISALIMTHNLPQYKDLSPLSIKEGCSWEILIPTDPAVLATYLDFFKDKEQAVTDIRFDWNDPEKDGYLIVMPLEDKLKFWRALTRVSREAKVIK